MKAMVSLRHILDRAKPKSAGIMDIHREPSKRTHIENDETELAWMTVPIGNMGEIFQYFMVIGMMSKPSFYAL